MLMDKKSALKFGKIIPKMRRYIKFFLCGFEFQFFMVVHKYYYRLYIDNTFKIVQSIIMFIKYKTVIYLRQYIFLYMTCSYPTKNFYKPIQTNS